MADLTPEQEKEQALKIVEDLIQKNQEMNIIITQDDNSAVGAGMALKEANLKDGGTAIYKNKDKNIIL